MAERRVAQQRSGGAPMPAAAPKGFVPPARRRPPMWHATLPLEALAPGALRRVVVAGRPVLLVRTAGGTVRACDAVCPHKYGPLEDGEVDGERLTCPLHAAAFDLATGAPEPGCEWAGRLPVFETRVRDGAVEVRLG